MFWSKHLWYQWLLSRQEPPHGAEGPDVICSGCFLPKCFDKSTYNIPQQVLQDGKECDLQNHLEGWMGDDGVYTVCTSMYVQPVPLVVSNATCHESSKWQCTGKGDKEKEDE